MAQRILITGITGLIGGTVLDKLLTQEGLEITALVRPNTNKHRYARFEGRIEIAFIDLADTESLISFLNKTSFNFIVHIGALRGGRKFSREKYYDSNVKSTGQFIEYALTNQARLLFCSSVGVFGAVPEEMPANNESPYKEDNYYHFTKILCEKHINQAIIKGLDAVILRPSITYGPGDKGFPLQLTRLVKSRIFPVSNKNIWIHLCHIDTISEAFVRLVTDKSEVTGKMYNVADAEPVQMRDLVNFIHRQIYNRNYPAYLTVDNGLLLLGERISRFLRNELWTARFELISHSWFYQVHDAYETLDLPQHYTIPDFRFMIRNLPDKEA
jgi:nucleoside-diphosphate-sugar epimerase